MTALATDDGRSIEELEAEALAAEKQWEEERKATYERLDPVSYTHLDVYKRQRLPAAVPLSAIGLTRPPQSWQYLTDEQAAILERSIA